MALRWYTVVVDCHDPRSLAHWWADVLGWTVFYDTEEECVIIPGYVTPDVVASTPWDRTPPGMVFGKSTDPKTVKNRLHIDLAPHIDDDRDAEIERLLAKGATHVDIGQTDDEPWDVLADPEGNEFCVLSSRPN